MVTLIVQEAPGARPSPQVVGSGKIPLAVMLEIARGTAAECREAPIASGSARARLGPPKLHDGGETATTSLWGVKLGHKSIVRARPCRRVQT